MTGDSDAWLHGPEVHGHGTASTGETAGHSTQSLVTDDPFAIWTSSSLLWHPCPGLLEALSPLRTLEEAPTPAEAFLVNSFSFLGMELIAGIFQKRKPGESHFSLNVERKQRPRLRAKSEWPGAPQPRLSQSGLHSRQSAPVTGLACLSLLQKTLP